MKRRAFTLIELLVVVAIAAGMVVLVISTTPRPCHENAPRASCQSNLKQIGLAFLQYTQDYDERLPRAVGSDAPYGWADAIQPYLKSTQFYQCPSESSGIISADPRANGYTDYWFNGNLQSAQSTQLPDGGMSLVMTGDGVTGNAFTNARYCQRYLPTAWLFDDSSPAYRHIGGMNLGFADGHVKFYVARKLSVQGAPNATFAVPTATPSPWPLKSKENS